MTTEKAIRDRFLECIDDLEHNEGLKYPVIALNIGTTASYLSQLRSKENPMIKASIIGQFCVSYNYSAWYILTGKGSKKAKEPMSKEERLTRSNERLIDLLGQMMEAMLELKPQWNDATKELIQEVKKRRQ